MTGRTPIKQRCFTAASMTGTTVVTGKAIRMRGLSRASLQAIWTGTPTGTFTFKQSNVHEACDENGTVLDSTKFTALVNPAAFAAQQPAGAASNGTIGVFGFADMACEWLLPIYTNSSSTGTLDGYGVSSP